MASIDPANETSQVLENLLALSNDVVLETGHVGAVNTELSTGGGSNVAASGIIIDF